MSVEKKPNGRRQRAGRSRSPRHPEQVWQAIASGPESGWPGFFKVLRH